MNLSGDWVNDLLVALPDEINTPDEISAPEWRVFMWVPQECNSSGHTIHIKGWTTCSIEPDFSTQWRIPINKCNINGTCQFFSQYNIGENIIFDDEFGNFSLKNYSGVYHMCICLNPCMIDAKIRRNNTGYINAFHISFRK